MPIDWPAFPAIGDPYTLAGRTWLWGGSKWEMNPTVPINPPPNTFVAPAKQGWYETIITPALSPVSSAPGVLLSYL